MSITDFLYFLLELQPKIVFQTNLESDNKWFTPVILATQEAEIRRIMFQGQPGEIAPETTSSK
jgi:hypothetical protein